MGFVTTPHGRVELRDLFGGIDAIPPPGSASGGWSVAGRRVTPEGASRLPAVLAGVRLLAETIGTFPMVVYRDVDNGREKARDSSQWALLHDAPNEHCTPFDLYSFMVASLQGYGNAYVLKAKTRSRGVVALYGLDPRLVRPRENGGEVTFEYRPKPGAAPVTLTSAEVIHVPGILLTSQYIGVSPITHHANALGIALATEEYAGRWYDNDATPSGALELPFGSDSQQARDQRELLEDRHRGVANAHRFMVLFGGAQWKQIGVNAKDAQIIEAQQWSVEQIARALRLPKWALGATDDGAARLTPEQRNSELRQFSILPWTVRIEQAFKADTDLFPKGAGLFPEFLTDALLRGDTAVRYEAFLKGRQAGWLSVNDIRAMENLPPIEGGDEYQTTPVGGAPNLQPATAPPVNQEAE